MDRPRIGVVGGGILGVAVAHRLLQRVPGAAVEVLEKESALARHQTGHNSGVVHAGLYYPPGSQKALLCRRGVGLLREYCRRAGLDYQEAGKLVVAVDAGEVTALRGLLERAEANGVPGLRWLEGEQVRSVEPAVAGVAAVHSPTTAIVDFAAVTRRLAADVESAGGRVLLGHEVVGLHGGRGEVVVETPHGARRYDLLVVCAGLHADRVARLAGDDPGPRIVPFRGEYFDLRPGRAHLVRGLVYPVPDPRYPFLGVHLTRHVDGRVSAGPNAVLALAREGYRRRDLVPRDLAETLAWPGFRRLARQHWRAGAGELASSLSRHRFAERVRRYLPDLRDDDLVRAPAGVRAQAVDAAGRLVDDFAISRTGRVVHVRNAPSPAATSSLAIADHVVDLLDLP